MLRIDISPFSLSELNDVIQKVNSNWAGGDDKFTSEMLLNLGEDTKPALLSIINETLDKPTRNACKGKSSNFQRNKTSQTETTEGVLPVCQ